MTADSLKEKRARRRQRRADVAANPIASAATTADAEEVQRGITAGKGRPTPSRRTRDEAEEEGNAVTRSVGGVREYVEGTNAEVQKVVWPTREEAARLFRVVLIVTIIAALFLGTVSAVFTQLFNFGTQQPWVLLAVFAVGVAAAVAYWRLRPQQTRREY